MMMPSNPNHNTNGAGVQGDLGALIQELTPLNNRWRESEGADRVLALWDVGDALVRHRKAPDDSLLWEVSDRSYITRNVLRYGLIVRRGWPKKSGLAEVVDGLQSYTVFREALPFLKGDRQGISDEEHERLLQLLRDADTKKATDQIKALKGRKIGRRHKKGKAATAVRDDATSFNQALRSLLDRIEAGRHPEASPDQWVALSRLALAVATGDGIDEVLVADGVGDVEGLGLPLLAAARGGRASVAAFRKLVGPERLMEAAALFNALRSKSTTDDWLRTRGVRLSL